MSTHQSATLDDPRIPVRAKLAAAWTSFMFLYAYVDILNFFKPGTVTDILDSKVWEFDMSQTFSTVALALMAVPIFMVVLSMTLPAPAARMTNLVVAAGYIPVTVFNLAGGEYVIFYSLGIVLELILLGMIARWACAWPRTAGTTMSATRSGGDPTHG